MEIVVISLLVWAGKGILERAGDDLLDSAYANLKGAGQPLLGRLLTGLRSGDETEVAAVAPVYANHLREHPEESAQVLAATVSAWGTQPVELFASIAGVMG